MVDRWDIARVVADCERYWKATGVPRQAAAEMRLELELHLAQAAAEGRSVETVLGDDVAAFAETWAAEYRTAQPPGRWDEIVRGEQQARRRRRRELAAYGIGAGALVVAAAVAGRQQGGTDVDNEIWRWVWTAFAVFMGIGEIFTAGFFLLPFAIGAAAAAVLAWIGVAVLAQWLVFFGVSLASLVYLQRFIRHQDEADQPAVGANRWKGASGVVLRDIDPVDGGMVRVDNEQWRAVTERDPIPEGTRVRVVDVRGTRLVVTPIDET